MRIDEIRVSRVAMPLKVPFRAAYGEDRLIETIYVRMRSGDVVGWGESAPQTRPYYCPEWSTGAFAVIRDGLAPLVVGREFESGQALQQALSAMRGNFFAKAAIDVAWWDVLGRMQCQPVWKLAGGTRDRVEVGADISLQPTTEALLDKIGGAVSAGAKRIKLKITRNTTDEELDRVRERFPDAVIHVDCNGAFTLDDTPRLKRLDRYRFAMIEQPLAWDDLLDHARLQQELETGICLDESITGLRQARQAIDIGACRWINIKPGRVGGFTNAVAIHAHCAERGMPNWVGSMLESDLGQGALLALATLPNMKYPGDIFPHGTFYATDLCRPTIEPVAPSVLAVGSAPGLGFEPDPDVLARQVVETAAIAPH